MKKKGIIIAAVVVVIIIVLVFVFSGKANAAETSTGSAGSAGNTGSTGSASTTGSVASKWDLSRGTMTLAQREAALADVFGWMKSYTLGWNPSNREQAVKDAIYQIWNARKVNPRAYPIEENYGADFLPKFVTNGIFDLALKG